MQKNGTLFFTAATIIVVFIGATALMATIAKRLKKKNE